MTQQATCQKRSEPHSPLHADYYADRAVFRSAPVVENVQTARDTFRLRIEAPQIARQITPGQFVMVRLAGQVDPMLGRAFALYDVIDSPSGQPNAIDIVYALHGKMTAALASCEPGRQVEVWGPLGNGIALEAASEAQRETQNSHLIMVAGGIGQTPFLALGKQSLGKQKYGETSQNEARFRQVSLCYGVRTADLLAGESDFRSAGIDLRIASDDGSIGHHGLVTDLLRSAIDESTGKHLQVVCCGPEKMMEAAAEVCRELGAPCLVSLETPMACGIGICFSCVAKVRGEDGEWDYKRTCVEGPVFDAEKIVW